MDDAEILAQAHRSAGELRETAQVFADLRAAMIEKMVSTTLDQQHMREKLFMAIQSLDAVKSALFQAAQSAEIVNYTVLLAERGLTNPNR